ncbi:S-adenosyl-L-methionine-dependent methyltransferases superfamily protein [Tanacetum coccineum]
MEVDMLKAQSKVVDILCNLELIYPPAFFDIMIHLVIHLPLEAFEGGPIRLGGLIWYVLHNSPKIDMYRAKFKSEFPNQDMKEEFLGWFGSQIRQRHIDEDPGVSASNELFALACGPTSSSILVNSCIVNGVRFFVHSRDERHTTQNNNICSPSEKDEEMYYGELEEILEFLYMSFKFVLFRVKWFDTSNEGHGQSMDVDAPLNIIDVDEDDDIIDDEDALPHDLVNSDDEDLINVDDDDAVDVVYSSEEED